MAGFGDSNDIKISVTVDAGPAINAALDIGEAFASIAKNIGVDFKTIAKATSNLADIRVAEIKKAAAEEVATIRSTSAERIEGIKKDVAEFKEGEVTKREQLKATADKTIQGLKTTANAYKQSQMTKRAELISAHNEEMQKLRASAEASKLFEVSKRDAAKASLSQTIAGLKAETSAAKQASLERIAGLKAASEALKAETSKEVRIFKESEATKRAEAKKTVEQLRLDAAKVRQATVAMQTEGAGKGGLGVDLPSLASGVFLFKEAIGLVNNLKNAVISLAEEGNRVQALATAFSTLQQSVGRDPAASIERLRTATQGLISDTELYQKANQAVLLQVPTQLFEESAEAAVKLGRAMGIDAAFALESLSIGLGRQSRLYLDNLGIVVSATQAYSNFARENNKLVDDLTDAEKRLAFFNETSKKLKEGLETLPPISRDVGVAFTEAKTTAANLVDQFLLGFNNSVELERGLTNLNETAKPLAGVFRGAGDALGSFIGKIINADYIPVIDELALRFRILGTAAANAVNDIFNLSNAAKVERLEELSTAIAKAKASLRVTKSPEARAGILYSIEQYEAEKKQIQGLLDEAQKRQQQQQSITIQAKVDTTAVSDSITDTSTALAQFKAKTEESLGLIRIPGLNTEAIDQIIPKVDGLFSKIESGTAGTAQQAAEQVSQLASSIINTVGNANIQIAKKALDAEKEALAQLTSKTGELTAKEQASVEASKVKIANLEAEVKLREESAGLDEKQRQQVFKFLDERRSRVKKQVADERKDAERGAKDAANALKQQQQQLKELTKSLGRSLGQAIPRDVQQKLLDVFNAPQQSAEELRARIEAIGEEFLKAGGDYQAFAKEVKGLNDLKQQFPNEKLLTSSEETKEIKAYNAQLAEARQGVLNLRDALKGIDKDAEGRQQGGGFFGFDTSGSFSEDTQKQLQEITGSETFAGFEAAVAKALIDGLKLAIDLAFSDFTRNDAPQIGTQIGTILGGEVGGIVGRLVGEYIMRNTQDLASTKERKQIDKYFGELFDGGRLGVIIQGQVRTAVSNGIVTIGETLQEAKPQLQRISDIVFEGFTPFAGQVQFGGEGFFNYFNTLASSVQNSFNGVGLAIGKLQGVSTETARLIGVALANNIGGSLQNLQVLIQATGESFEDLSKAITEAFLNAELTIDEAYNSLIQLQNLSEKGIPGAFGAWKEALDNFSTAIREEQPGRYALDAFRDIASEGIEAGKTFEEIGGQIAGSLGLTEEQVGLFFAAMRSVGITNLSQLENASVEAFISILAKAKAIKDGIATTAQEVTAIPNVPTPQVRSGGGGKREKSAGELAKELLEKQREEARKLLQDSQAYLTIIDQINKGQIGNVEAGKEIVRLQKDLLNTIIARDKIEKALNAELDKGAKGSKKRIAELAAELSKLEEKLEKARKKAGEVTREYKTLDIDAIIPLIRSQNSLGVVARQIGVDLKKNIDVLVKGFMQGRLSISEANKEIAKTKELLGPGIPNSVGAVTDAFQNLIDAGTTGGSFSTDAFVDIFAEFREKFNREGSALREAQRKQLNENLAAAQEAVRTAVGPEASQAALKALDVAKKALDDFRNEPLVPDLSDLKEQLKSSFSPEQVDIFFRALDESGLKTFEEFENASTETVLSILGRIEELGFKFNETSEEIQGVNQGLVDAETAANGGLDPLAQAIDLVRQFNEGAETLPPAFNSTTEAIDKLNGPLEKLANSFGNIVEKLGKLSGNTFENDIVFNIRTTGDQGGQALVELIFGDGTDVSAPTGSGGGGTTGGGGSTGGGKPTSGGRATGNGKKSDWTRESPGFWRNKKTKRVIRSAKNPGA
jgi:hypothetical protein